MKNQNQNINIENQTIIFEPVTPYPEPVVIGDLLNYGATVLPKEEEVPFYQREWMWATIVVVIFAVLNIMFW